MPILHTHDGPLGFYASFPLVGDRLHVGFARVRISDTARVGMSHLLWNRLVQMSEEEIEELVAEAAGNLMDQLRFTVFVDEEKGRMAILERPDGNLRAAPAIVMGDFPGQAAEQIGEDELIVGLISPDQLCIAGARSGWVEEIMDWVRTSPDPSGDLVPAVLLMDRSGIREMVAERPTGRVPAACRWGRPLGSTPEGTAASRQLVDRRLGLALDRAQRVLRGRVGGVEAGVGFGGGAGAAEGLRSIRYSIPTSPPDQEPLWPSGPSEGPARRTVPRTVSAAAAVKPHGSRRMGTPCVQGLRRQPCP
ncbi:DNA topoisomerase VI subunit B [Amycolatopsis granulosa]|nr:hypothetical protein [Amycolatopsis granulosa]NIH87060.1 DNA topoisomerase VI subunit B [Amycolatopsis granulosa]